MRANEFVKKFGFKSAKYWIDHFNNVNMLPNEFINIEFLSNVKLLVESHELVMDYYGLTKAKEHAESNYTAPELKATLKQAIADVESCL